MILGKRFQTSNEVHKRKKKCWITRITYYGKAINLGAFYTARQAGLTYDLNAAVLFEE
jgi:hypothetical protein